MTQRKVFISSVRSGLEEERDALPALIKALGDVPRRFEDFTAQPVPSRDSCLAGVEDADIYLLVLGPRYGEPLPDSGLSPTAEEWTVAKRRGIPIIVFRKLDVDVETKQNEFVQQVEDYVTGRFRDSFVGVGDLLPKVAEKLRELAADTGPLVWRPLDGPLQPPWIASHDPGVYRGAIGPTLELHVLPLGTQQRLAARALEGLPERLSRMARDHGLFGPGDALDLSNTMDTATAVRASSRELSTAGIAVSRSRVVSVWNGLPRDSMGSILDRNDVVERLARYLRMAVEMIPTNVGEVACAVGLGPTQMVAEGNVADLGRRKSASLRMSDRTIRIEADDAIPRHALGAAGNEVAAELAARLVVRFRQG